MAKSISVAVGDSETIFDGFGADDDDAVVAAGLESLPQAWPRAATQAESK